MISVLFARADSIYKKYRGVEVWDKRRDARNWPGGNSLIAHPPCAQWGVLSHFANKSDEKELAPWAVNQVREWGGVLEHPVGSRLWAECALAEPGERDYRGGFTLVIRQFDFGHWAEKLTRLYVCGIEPEECPSMPARRTDTPHFCITSSNRHKPEVPKAMREHTPRRLAEWLIELANRCERKSNR